MGLLGMGIDGEFMMASFGLSSLILRLRIMNILCLLFMRLLLYPQITHFYNYLIYYYHLPIISYTKYTETKNS